MSRPTQVVVISVDDLERVVARAVAEGVRNALAERQVTTTEEWMTPEQVAQLLGYRRSYVPELVRRQGLPCIKYGRMQRFERSAVLAWAQERGSRVACRRRRMEND